MSNRKAPAGILQGDEVAYLDFQISLQILHIDLQIAAVDTDRDLIVKSIKGNRRIVFKIVYDHLFLLQ